MLRRLIKGIKGSQGLNYRFIKRIKGSYGLRRRLRILIGQLNG